MTYVRPADLEKDRAAINSLLRRSLGANADDRRFDWLYHENPFGPAQAWVAVDESQGEVIGTAALFPRRMYLANEEASGCVLGDFCIAAGSRTLGPALELQRVCLAAVNSGSWSIAYDLPSRNMMAVYRRLEVSTPHHCVRFSKLLRIDNMLSASLGQGAVSRVLCALVNTALKALDLRRRNSHSFIVESYNGPCGEEFSALAQQVGTSYGNCTVRSAAYLNWRYFNHPFRSYEMVTARRKGALCGYIVFSQWNSCALVADLFALPDPLIIAELLGELTLLLRRRKFSSISCACLQGSAVVPLLLRAGFREREASPLLLWQPNKDGPGCSANGQQWLLFDGDRES